MKRFLILVSLLCSAGRLWADSVFVFALGANGGRYPQWVPGVATLILRGRELEYGFSLSGAYAGQNRVKFGFHDGDAVIELSPFESGSGSGCTSYHWFEGPQVMSGDISSFFKPLTIEWPADEHICRAIQYYSGARGKVTLSERDAARLARGGFDFRLLDAGEAGQALPAQRLWGGIFRDVVGKPLADLEMHCWRPNGAVWQHRSTRTDNNGVWSIELPVGDWRIAARPDELLARGYFCEPGSVVGSPWTCANAQFDPVTGQFMVVECDPSTFPAVGILWGPGSIEWTPSPEDAPIILTAVPTRPSLEVIKSPNAGASIQLSFETQQTLPMTVTRQWRVEKSTDLIHWTPLQTVALGQLSPIVVPDSGSITQALCYYRAAMVEDVIAPTP